MKWLLTNEDMQRALQAAVLKSMEDDGVVNADELSKHLLDITGQMNIEACNKEYERIMGTNTDFYTPTSAKLYTQEDIDAVASRQRTLKDEHLRAVEEKIMKNAQIVAMVAGTLTAVGSATITGGLTLPAALAALAPVATFIAKEIASKDEDPIGTLPTPDIAAAVASAASGIVKAREMAQSYTFGSADPRNYANKLLDTTTGQAHQPTPTHTDTHTTHPTHPAPDHTKPPTHSDHNPHHPSHNPHHPV